MEPDKSPLEIEKISVGQLIHFAQRLTLGSVLFLLGVAASIFGAGISVCSLRTQTGADSAKPSVTLTLSPEFNRDQAPFRLEVQGTAAQAARYYLYAVVDDGNANWIQPGLGANRDGTFYSAVHLGLEKGKESLNKWYTVFAVVSNRKHEPYQHLVPESVLARSALIRVYRTH